MSGIYIKGMEMPRNCMDCCVYWDKCPVWRMSEVCKDYSDKVHLDCPLIPVPDHGRLGDLGALREAVGEVELKARKEYYELSDAEKECEYEMGVWDGIHMAAKIISTAPTIIPASKQEVDT